MSQAAPLTITTCRWHLLSATGISTCSGSPSCGPSSTCVARTREAGSKQLIYAVWVNAPPARPRTRRHHYARPHRCTWFDGRPTEQWPDRTDTDVRNADSRVAPGRLPRECCRGTGDRAQSRSKLAWSLFRLPDTRRCSRNTDRDRSSRMRCGAARLSGCTTRSSREVAHPQGRPEAGRREQR
jgi:hypothetical protein